MMRIGGHFHSDDPLQDAVACGARAAQFFLGDPQGWKGPVVPGGDPGALRDAYAAADVDIYIHAPYVINVASANNRIRIPSRKLLAQHLKAAASVGAKGLIVHGGHVTGDTGPATGVANWVKAIEQIERPLPMLIENTAGGGGAMARSLDAIARLWEAISPVADAGGEVGFCLDTCHANSAGIDLADVVDRVKAITGRIDLVHCNNSRDEFGSGADRHANFESGTIDPQALLGVVRAAGAPVICETPEAGLAADIAWLQSQVLRAGRTFARRRAGEAMTQPTAARDADDRAGIAALVRSALEHYYYDQETLDEVKWRQFIADAEGLRDHGAASVAAVTDLFAGETRDRVVAAALLGHMSREAPQTLRELCWSGLESMLAAEWAGQANPSVFQTVAGAVSDLEDARALPSLVRLAAHPCAGVRFAVASAIPRTCCFTAREDAVACLVTLTSDEDADVRDWACFGLGQLNAEGPEVRDALAARLDDEDVDTRCEALVALAKTGDPRAYDKLAERLGAGGEWKLELEAAAELADPRLHPVLRHLADDWRDDDDFENFRWDLERAIARTDHRQRDLARTTEQWLAAELSGQLTGAGRSVRLTGEYPRTRLIVRTDSGGRELLNDRIWEFHHPGNFDRDRALASYLSTVAQEDA